MAKKLESRTALTQFAPLSPELKSQSFSIRNMFWKSKDKSNTSDKSPTKSLEDEAETSNVHRHILPEILDISPSENSRSMSGILSKIMDNIVDKKKKGLQNYRDSDFKQYWMPDNNCRECYECGDRFTTFRRRHHCRVCGQIFCWKCCSHQIPGHLIGYTDDLRVCSYCCKTVLSCVQSLDMGTESDSQPKKFRLDSQSEPPSTTTSKQPSPVRRKSSVIGFREEDIAKAKPFKSTLNRKITRERPPKIEGPIQDRKHLKEIVQDLLNSVQSVSLWKQDYKDHQNTKIILGSDIVDWLLKHNICLSRNEAISMGQAFIDTQLFESIMPQQNFVDGNVFYKPLEPFEQPKKTDSASEIQESMEPLWVKEIQPAESYVFKDNSAATTPLSPNMPKLKGSLSRLSSSSSMFYLDLDVRESRVSIFKSQSEGQDLKTPEKIVGGQNDVLSPITPKLPTSNTDDSFIADDLDSTIMKSVISSQTWQSPQPKDDNEEKVTFDNLNSAYKQHEATLLSQLLSSEGLSLSWSEIILPMIHHIVDSVHPDIKNDCDDMDIRQYVQFKKIPGGNKSESSIVSGVVFSKTVAHKKMKQRIRQPTVLLLSSSISYQRVENKLSSLDPILMQEHEYLKNTIGKLTVFKPDVLLVEKLVSRLAREMLLDLGVTVAINVKPSVMERVARCTQAAIVSTIDAHLGRPQLGTCDKLKVKTYTLPGGKHKTLMFFDGCPKNLGCTVLLRGGPPAELKKVKQVVQFMVYVAYNWTLERSFLMDEFATLPYLTEQMDVTVETVIEENADLGQNDKSHIKRFETKDFGKRLETESISDFSDPLHSYLQLENDVFQPEPCDLKVNTLPSVNTFSKVLDDIALCTSLNIQTSPPFLETELGRKCELRKYFPQEIYWSKHFAKENKVEVLRTQIDTQTDMEEDNISLKGLINSKNVEIVPTHKFVSYKITDILKHSTEAQALLADFRARGGTIRHLCPHEKEARERKVNHTTAKVQPETVSQNTGLSWEKKIDALDPVNHQKLSVLFSSYSCLSENAPNYCVNPWVVKMEFYGSNDITLGGFLERYCFRSIYRCPSSLCATPMTEHVRKFVHGNGCVHILLHELGSVAQVAENSILMWSWCHMCKKASPVVSMSQDTWSFSFAKYLELRFYADGYKRRGTDEDCSHSLHHDNYQYFAQNDLVAIFKYTPIFIWSVMFPTFVISVKDKVPSINSILDKMKVISTKGHTIYADLQTILHALLKDYSDMSSEDFIEDMISMLKLETAPFRSKVENIQTDLVSPTLENMKMSATDIEHNKDLCNYMWKIEDQLKLLKYHIADTVHVWNNRIQEFLSARKKELKQQNKFASQSSRISEEDPGIKFNGAILDDTFTSSPDSKITLDSKITPLKSDKRKDSTCKDKCRRISCANRSYSCGNINDKLSRASGTPRIKRTRSEPDYLLCHEEECNNVFLQRNNSLSSSDSCYVYGVTPGIYAGLRASEVEDYDTYIVCHKDSIEDYKDTSSPRKHHSRSKSETEAIITNSHNSKQTPEKTDSVKPEKKERTVKNLLSQFLPSSMFTQIENPFPAAEHLLLPSPQKIAVILHEDEPSSVIAYTLATEDYEQKLQELRLNLNVNSSQKESQTSSPMLKHRVVTDSAKITVDAYFSSDDTFDFSIDSSTDSKLKPSSATNRWSPHLETQFSDTTTKFYCRVYYAENFRKLRSLLFSEGEERYIRSLSHCIQWAARGGKSGSLFCKTHDDRFILKQMPRLELQSFMELAPSYFQYLNKAYLEQKPTVLAKIVGIYRIGFKNTATNAATKMDLLVMENLFYGRNITRRYDLKGSVRNRLVNTIGMEPEDIVLLDENLIKMSCDSPLYVGHHSRALLSKAIHRDTQFLLDQSVMDYSLLVGLQEDTGQLAVGIIDYIRTFTWDKKVEMLIKSSGLLGGHGKMPTVVSPELYKMRFCEAMDSYFLWVPNRWTGLGQGFEDK